MVCGQDQILCQKKRKQSRQTFAQTYVPQEVATPDLCGYHFGDSAQNYFS